MAALQLLWSMRPDHMGVNHILEPAQNLMGTTFFMKKLAITGGDDKPTATL
jgi:hypothetical protein